MKGKYLPFLILPLLVFGFLFFSLVGVRAEQPNPDHKIDICHRTNSHSNPYTVNNVDKNSTAGGHGSHIGPIWYEGIVGDWGDIIPSYTYSEWEVIHTEVTCPKNNNAYGFWAAGKTCSKKIGFFTWYAYPVVENISGWVDYQFPGLNWTSEGQAIWNNGCEIPYSPCDETVEVIGDWTEWMLDPNDDTQEYREKESKFVDSQDNSFICEGPFVETQTRYRVCSRTVRSFTEWSDWMIDPEDETQEYRTREGTAVDSQNSEVVCAGPVVLTEKRDREIEYENCTYTSEIYGEWSDWTVDPSDSTREYRERIVNIVDVEDSEYLCGEPKTETEYRDITVEEDPIVEDELEVLEEDEPEVLGTQTKVEEEEIEEVGVVLAETASTSNILVYIVQAILSLSTLLSGIFFSKKYIM